MIAYSSRAAIAGNETQKLIDGQFQTDLNARIARKFAALFAFIAMVWRGVCGVTNAWPAPGRSQRSDQHAAGPASKAGPLLKFAEALNGSETVRAAAVRTGIDKSTSFRWRHRFLKAQKDLKDQRLTGIVEVDECFVLQSRKGERRLPRKARKRGGKAEKPGLSRANKRRS